MDRNEDIGDAMARLTEQDIALYAEQGWIVPDYRVPVDLLAEARARLKAMMAARPDYQDLYPDLLGADIRFIEMAREPGLLEILEQLIGPDIALWTGAVFGKPAGNGKATPWHQDGEYWPIRPLETTTVWVALDESTPANGCLRVISGSHKARRLLPHRERSGELTLFQEVDADAYDNSRAADIVLQPGQVSIHDVYLIHGSEPNRSDQRRAGVTYRYMPARCHFDRDLAARQAAAQTIPDISRRPVYLLRGSAADSATDFDPIPQPAGESTA